MLVDDNETHMKQGIMNASITGQRDGPSDAKNELLSGS
jgi:hypothetical protein